MTAVASWTNISVTKRLIAGTNDGEACIYGTSSGDDENNKDYIIASG